MKQNKLSIIIPVFNEEASIAKLIKEINTRSTFKQIDEIIVVDGGSTDNTTTVATTLNVTVISSEKGRAKQMNAGAKVANGDILYFLHADTIPPYQFDCKILKAITDQNAAGSFRMQFDSKSIFLKFFAWFTRINHKVCRGGDQSLFITKDLFFKLNGFNEEYIIYEDGEFIERLYKATNFSVIQDKVTTSARKYQEKGMVKLQYHFGVIHLKKILGKTPQELHNYYKKNIAN